MRFLPLALAGTIALGGAAAASPALAAPAPIVYRTYANCTALNKVYKHGVGRVGAVDKTSGTRVRNYYANTRLYLLNKKSDRDKDGIACEKR